MQNLYFEDDEIYIRCVRQQDEAAVWEFKKEFSDNNENTQGTTALNKAQSFDEWLEMIEKYSSKESVPTTHAASTQFLAFRKSDNRLVGMVNVRHYLTENLLEFGGHVGDCVRLSERNKGYATRQIALSLKYLKTLNVDRVLVVCLSDNPASRRTIVKNGGVLENVVVKDGKEHERYWINI